MPSFLVQPRSAPVPPLRPRLRPAGALLLHCLVVSALLTSAVWGQQATPTAMATPTPPGTGAAPDAKPGVQAPPLGRLVATPSAPQRDPMDDLESLTPPDGKWLPAEDGREYFLTRLKKVDGTYTKYPDGKTVAYQKIYRWTYDREDDDYFYVRVYKLSAVDPGVDPDAAQTVAKQNAAIAEKYKVELRDVDRLQFAGYDTGLPREGQWRQGFDVADMNGDGHLDILHNSPRKQIFAPVVFLGDGKGGWRYWDDVIWPRVPFDYGDAAAGDFDGDGRMDIALAIHLRGIKVLLQTTPGHFVDASEGLQFAVPGKGGDASEFASRAVEVADWNGDGKLDVVALGEGARQVSTAGSTVSGLPSTSAYGIVIYLNEGGAKWRALSVGATDGVFGDSFAFAHLDEDERLDLVSASSTMGNRRVLFLNAEEQDGYEEIDLPSIPNLAFTYAVATGDFDEDGRDDVVTSFGTNEGGLGRSGISLHSRDAEAVWRPRLWFTDHAVEASWALAAGDLDGDQHLDLVATTSGGKVTILLGDGKGGVALETAPELDPPSACRGYAVRLADLDEDGRPEILTSFAGEAGDMAKLLEQPVCQTEGALRVWKAGPKPNSEAGKANS